MPYVAMDKGQQFNYDDGGANTVQIAGTYAAGSWVKIAENTQGARIAVTTFVNDEAVGGKTIRLAKEVSTATSLTAPFFDQVAPGEIRSIILDHNVTALWARASAANPKYRCGTSC